jgi:hypothetical protein
MQRERVFKDHILCADQPQCCSGVSVTASIIASLSLSPSYCLAQRCSSIHIFFFAPLFFMQTLLDCHRDFFLSVCPLFPPCIITSGGSVLAVNPAAFFFPREQSLGRHRRWQLVV